MIRFEFCTATTICVDIKEQARMQAAWNARGLDAFFDQDPQVVVFRDGQDMVGVADEEQVVRGEMCKEWFMLSPTMFQEARDAFRDRLAPEMRVFVLNDEQRVVGVVRYEKNYLDKGWQDPQDYWDYDFQLQNIGSKTSSDLLS